MSVNYATIARFRELNFYCTSCSKSCRRNFIAVFPTTEVFWVACCHACATKRDANYSGLPFMEIYLKNTDELLSQLMTAGKPLLVLGDSEPWED